MIFQWNLRKNTDDDGSNIIVHVSNEHAAIAETFTPEQVRELAKALNQLADELDPAPTNGKQRRKARHG